MVDTRHTSNRSRLRYLSVCSGIEAVSLAWEPLGWQPAMFAEIAPFCCWLLRSRYRASRPAYMPSPHDAATRKEAKQRAAAIRNVVALPADGAVINTGDFTRIRAADVGTIDLLAGGTPCQSFSVAGKRAGLDDPRGNLTIEFARLADRLRPCGWCGRTSPVSPRLTEEGRLEPFSACWSNSGMGSPTEFSTLSFSEYPSAAAVSSLSDVLETGELPQRYFLSGTACRGILRRAEKRGKELPQALRSALLAVASRTPLLPSTPDARTGSSAIN